LFQEFIKLTRNNIFCDILEAYISLFCVVGVLYKGFNYFTFLLHISPIFNYFISEANPFIIATNLSDNYEVYFGSISRAKAAAERMPRIKIINKIKQYMMYL